MIELNFEFVGLDIYTLLLIMLIYSFLGWFYESTIYSIIEQGRLMNRGYFLGPYCPIYSVVGIACVYLMNGVDSAIKIFVVSALTCCAIEYVTSYVLEKLFDARYWDYSAYPLNINGRISAISGIFFGLLLLFLVKVLHPALVEWIGKIPDKMCVILSASLVAIFLVDLIVTTVSMCNLNKKFKEVYDYINDYIDDKFETMTDKSKFLDEHAIIEKRKDITVALLGMTKKFKENELHFFRAFPYFKSNKYKDLAEKMKESLRLKKNRDNSIEDVEEKNDSLS